MMPPMQPPMDDMGQQPPMNEPPMPPAEEGPNDMDNPDGDDMDMSPKKEIQKQTGALSQALNQYNQEQEEPDTELNKYVMNMIGKQAGKAMTSKDKKEVMKKMNSSEDDLGDKETAEDMEAETEMEMNGENGMPDETGNTMESFRRDYGELIDEVVNSVLSSSKKKEDVKRKKKDVSNPNVSYDSPFVCN